MGLETRWAGAATGAAATDSEGLDAETDGFVVLPWTAETLTWFSLEPRGTPVVGPREPGRETRWEGIYIVARYLV